MADAPHGLPCVLLRPACGPEAMAAMCRSGRCPCLGFACPLGQGPAPCGDLAQDVLAGMWRNAFGRMQERWAMDRQIDLLAAACASLDGVAFSIALPPGKRRDWEFWLEWSRKESRRKSRETIHLN